MGTSWAVGSAVTLALAAVGLVLAGGAYATATWYLLLAIVPLVATWAYAIAMGAHGSRTALVAIGFLVATVALAAPFLLWHALSAAGGRLGATLAVALALVGAPTLWALWHEARRRGGPIHVGTVIALVSPLLLTALSIYAVHVLHGAQSMDPSELYPGQSVHVVGDNASNGSTGRA